MKLYKSKAWLTKRVNHDRKTPEEIAKECGVSLMTIYRQMKEFGLKQ